MIEVKLMFRFSRQGRLVTTLGGGREKIGRRREVFYFSDDKSTNKHGNRQRELLIINDNDNLYQECSPKGKTEEKKYYL